MTEDLKADWRGSKRPLLDMRDKSSLDTTVAKRIEVGRGSKVRVEGLEAITSLDSDVLLINKNYISEIAPAGIQ